MNTTELFVLDLLTVATAGYACRIAGYLLIGRVPTTPRLEAALRQAPMGVMIGVVLPGALRCGVAEFIGLFVVIAAAFIVRNDLVAALAGVAAVALWRDSAPPTARTAGLIVQRHAWTANLAPLLEKFGHGRSAGSA